MIDKKYIFFYFVYKLRQRYDQVSPNMPINRYHILKMLFLAVVNNNNLLLYFDNFYAMENGPVESDCYLYIYSLNQGFERILLDNDSLVSLLSPDLDDNIKKIIENSIYTISESFFKKTSSFLVEYTHTFASWKEAWEKCKIYNKRAYPMSRESIIKEFN